MNLLTSKARDDSVMAEGASRASYGLGKRRDSLHRIVGDQATARRQWTANVGIWCLLSDDPETPSLSPSEVPPPWNTISWGIEHKLRIAMLGS